MDQLGAVFPDFVFVFSTIGYEHQDVLDAVAEIVSDVPMSGVTFEGIIGLDFADETMYAVQIVGFKSHFPPPGQHTEMRSPTKKPLVKL